MGDRIVVMKDGIIQQVDTPEPVRYAPQYVRGELYRQPPDELPGRHPDQEGATSTALTWAATSSPAQREKTADGKLDAYVGKKIKMGIRPEDIDDEPGVYGKAHRLPAGCTGGCVEMMGAEIYLYLGTRATR